MDNYQINLLRPDQQPPVSPRRHRRLFILIAILIFLLLLNSLVKKLTIADWPDDPGAYDPQTLTPKQTGILQTVTNFIFRSDNVLFGQNEDRVNILLLGMGGAGHDGPYLTDSNIILSLRPQAKDVALISVPRDLQVKIGEFGWRKINQANAFGEVKHPGQGAEFARGIFQNTFDIDIPYYVRVDFAAFTELIDIVGGINVNVKRPFVDPEYPGPNHSYQTIIFTAGPQTLNGERALQYARSRHGSNGEGSDFARAQRQQEVIAALKEKIVSSDTYTKPARLKQIWDTVARHVDTNLNFGQIMYLAGLSKQIDLNDLKTLVLDDGVDGFLSASIQNGGFYLTPKTGNFKEINRAIAEVFNADSNSNQAAGLTPAQSAIFPAAKIEIQNGTWQAGLAGRTQQKLQTLGFDIDSIGNCAIRPVSSTAIYLLNANASPEIIKGLEKEFATTAKIAPAWLKSINTTGTPSDIIVVLGENTQ